MDPWQGPRVVLACLVGPFAHAHCRCRCWLERCVPRPVLPAVPGRRHPLGEGAVVRGADAGLCRRRRERGPPGPSRRGRGDLLLNEFVPQAQGRLLGEASLGALGGSATPDGVGGARGLGQFWTFPRWAGLVAPPGRRPGVRGGSSGRFRQVRGWAPRAGRAAPEWVPREGVFSVSRGMARWRWRPSRVRSSPRTPTALAQPLALHGLPQALDLTQVCAGPCSAGSVPRAMPCRLGDGKGGLRGRWLVLGLWASGQRC